MCGQLFDPPASKYSNHSSEELVKRFVITRPGPQSQLHNDISMRFVGLGGYLDEHLPPGRAKEVTFTQLEQASLWAHKVLDDLDTTVDL